MAPITKRRTPEYPRQLVRDDGALQRGHGQHVNDQGGDAAKDLDDKSQLRDEGLLEFIGQLLDWSARSPIVVLTLARPELSARHQGCQPGSATL